MSAAALVLNDGATAIAIEIEFEDGGAMHQPVDGVKGHGLVGEDGVSLFERLVGRDEKSSCS